MNMLKKTIEIKELKYLNDFLIQPHQDSKPFPLTKMHGFFCAIISAPSLIMPSQYLPILLDGSPAFESEEHAKSIIDILSRFYNNISTQLKKGEKMLPFIWQNNEAIRYTDASFELIQCWCSGYLAGVRLDPVWMKNKPGIALLFPLGVLANEFSLKGSLDNKGNPIEDDLPFKEESRKLLPEDIKIIYNFWEKGRQNGNPPIYEKEKPIIRKQAKIGRNEKCPCDSGKKFKKCCGSSSRTLH